MSNKESYSVDELIEELERAEYEGASHLSPIDFARLHHMRPQQVYYLIRRKVLATETCQCGRNVLDRSAAEANLRAYLAERKGS